MDVVLLWAANVLNLGADISATGSTLKLLVGGFGARFCSAVFNGIAAVPLMALMVLMATNPRVMDDFTLMGWLRASGWAAGPFAAWGR